MWVSAWLLSKGKIIFRAGTRGVGILVWAGITKYHRLDNLNNSYFSVLQAVEFKIKVLADSVPGNGPLPGLQMSGFMLSSMVEKECLLIRS
jgi:hypothetical protein